MAVPPKLPRSSAPLFPPGAEPQRVTDTGADLEASLFGTMDGLVTSLAVVAGVVATGLSVADVVIAGVSAMLAGALSMFVGAYVSSRARWELAKRERRREEEEVETVPEVEREEVRTIFRSWGFPEDEARSVTERMASDKKVWVEFMMREELGFTQQDLERPPKRKAAVIGLAYLGGSLIPLLSFLILPLLSSTANAWSDLVGATFLSAIALGSFGAYKERFGGERPARGALQMIGIGLGAAVAVFVLTNLLFHHL